MSVNLATIKTIVCHAVIIFFREKRFEANKNVYRNAKFLDESVPLNTMVYNWTGEFKRGHTSIEDDPRAGHAKSASNSDDIRQNRIWFWEIVE